MGKSKENLLTKLIEFKQFGLISFKKLIDLNIFTKKIIKYNNHNMVIYILKSNNIEYIVDKEVFDYAINITNIRIEFSPLTMSQYE